MTVVTHPERGDQAELRPLRVLILEDNPTDVELMLHELRRTGYAVECRRVETEEGFRSGLADAPDVILSDFDVPGFDGLRALEVLRELEGDTPFLLVSGTIGEELAVDAMRHGANDYILKDRLTRLGAAVEAALHHGSLAEESRRRQAALDENQARLQGLFDSTVDALLLADDGGRYVDVNPAACELTGYTKAELLGMSVWDLTPADDLDEGRARWRAFLAEGAMSGDYTLTTRDGSLVDVEFRTTANIVDGLHLSVLRDVTERRTAERALRESEERFRQLAENVDQVFWIVQTDGDAPTTIYISPAYETIVGLPSEELIADPRAWRRIIHPEDRDRVVASRERMTAEPTEQEYRIARPDGETRWIRDRTFPIADEVGRVYRVAGVAEDVTDRVTADAQIRDMEARLRFLVSTVPGTIYSLDVADQPTPTFVSDNALVQFGYEPEDMMTPGFWWEQIHPGDRAQMTEGIERTFGDGHTSDVYRFRHRDGSWRWMHDELLLVRDDDGAPLEILGHSLDVSDLMEAEAELRQSLERLRRSDAERRRLLARLTRAQEEERQRIAADIHDDSVQVMTAVGLRLQTVRRHIDDPDQLDRLTTLQRTVELATSRLRNLLFELRPRSLDTDGLETALRVYLEHTCAEIGLDHEVTSRLRREPPTETRVILYRIAQEALTNVRKHAAATRVRVTLSEQGGGYHVAVADDGRGFQPERPEETPDALAHVGLASMRDRAESAGGWWRVASGPGHGTTVEFWLPPIDADEDEIVSLEASTDGSAPDTEHDSEEMAR